MNLLNLPFLHSILVFFATDIARNSFMAMHNSIYERINSKVREAWAIQQNMLVEFMSDPLCRSSFCVNQP